MNRQRFLKSIIWVENTPEEEFDMDYWFTTPDGSNITSVNGHEFPCGTTACYAGTVQFNAAKTQQEKDQNAPEFAEQWLTKGLGDSEMWHQVFCHLFMPSSYLYKSTDRKGVVEALVALYNCAGNPGETLKRYDDYYGSVHWFDKPMPMVEWAAEQPQLPNNQQTWVAI